MVSLRHSTQASGTNNPNKQVSVDVWNEEHALTGGAGNFVQFDESGVASEVDLSARSGASKIGVSPVGTVADVATRPRRLSYGKRNPRYTNRQAVADLLTIKDEIVGFAKYANTIGGYGYLNYYVNDPSLDTSAQYSLGTQLAAVKAAGGGNIYFDPMGRFDVNISTLLTIDFNNVTIYAPGANVTFWCDRIRGAVYITGQNIIFKNIYFRTRPGPINGTVIGLDESTAQTIVKIRSDYSDKVAFLNCEFRKPSWHCLDMYRATVPDGHLFRASVQNCIFWDCIQGHLIGTTNGALTVGTYTSDTTVREQFATFHQCVWAYSLQRNPKVLGAAYVDMVDCYTLLRPYETEYLGNGYPEVMTSAYGGGVQEGGWLRVRGCLFQSAHADIDGQYATHLVTGYSGNTGRIYTDSTSAAENSLVFETRNGNLIDALPYTLTETPVPAAGAAREAWVAALWAKVGARADAAPEGMFKYVAGSTQYPNGETVLIDFDDRTSRAGLYERVDRLGEYEAVISESAVLLDYAAQDGTNRVGRKEGASSGAVIGATMLDITGATSSYFPLVGDGGAATLKHVVSSDNNISDGLHLEMFGSPSAPVTVVTATSIATTVADVTANTLTITGHGEATSGFPLSLRSSGTLPGGLSNSTVYYANRVDVNTIKLALTYDDAVAGTNIVDITSAGTGTHTATIGSFDLPDGAPIVINSSTVAVSFRFNVNTLRFQLEGNPGSAGAYTPTLTTVANCSALSVGKAQYQRNGSVVTATVLVNGTQTSGSTLTKVGISLPIASNLAAVGDLLGNCVTSSVTPISGGITGDTTNDRAEAQWVCSGSAGAGFSLICQFQYEIK